MYLTLQPAIQYGNQGVPVKRYFPATRTVSLINRRSSVINVTGWSWLLPCDVNWCLTLLVDVNQCQSMSFDVSQCWLMSPNVTPMVKHTRHNVGGHQLLSVVITCQHLSSHVDTCHHMLILVNTCWHLSTHVDTCQHMSTVVATCHQGLSVVIKVVSRGFTVSQYLFWPFVRGRQKRAFYRYSLVIRECNMWGQA